MENLQKSFEQEPKKEKVVLASAGVVFISSFLPWFSMSFGGFGGVSVNGWNRFGIITAIAALALILNWVLPKVGVKFDLKVKADVLQKILVATMLLGVILWMIDGSFEISAMGVGFYLALAGSAVATYMVFGQKKAVKM